ncbi:MAG: 4Fe-4S dicluster domain-containing protein [Desulfosarcina sp.]|nr:4Fe-4S dicluster domain-containing protein [Desulfosarcina sp.]MBC2742141.1 4Fe-4S dicluster domain-containing protein [Desulfosarcina sp.]MBC2765054.1 heterodisulfide reductase [Desulfosarcina sp.]
MDDQHLLDQFFTHPDCRKVRSCIQCGTCSGSCPLAAEMDHAPRELFALIRDGEIDIALRSNTPWYCVSCYQCMDRCPQEIPVADIMYRLKQMAIAAGCQPRSHKLPDFYRAFADDMGRNGRMTETHVMARYSLKHPMDAAANMATALKLLARGRLDLIPNRTHHPAQIAALTTMCRKRGSDS